MYKGVSTDTMNENTYIASQKMKFSRNLFTEIFFFEKTSLADLTNKTLLDVDFFWSRGFSFFLNAAMFGWETPSLSAILALLRVSKTASFETMRHLIIRVDTSAQFCNIGSAVEIILRCCTPGRFLWQCTKFVTSGIHKTI